MSLDTLSKLEDALGINLIYDEYLENLEIQEGACTFAPQTLNMIERLSAEPIQQKQGLRENYSTSARDKD